MTTSLESKRPQSCDELRGYEHKTYKDTMITLEKTEIKIEKIDVSHCPYVAIDAEWVQLLLNLTASYLTKQMTFLDKDLNNVVTYVLWHEGYELPDKEHIEYLCKVVGHPVIFIPCDVQNTTIHAIGKLAPTVKVLMYYSPKDVEAMIGREAWRDILLCKNSPIDKKRNLTGEFKSEGTTFILKDLFGTFNKSLDKALTSVGIDPKFKNIVEKMGYRKDRLDLFMKDHPNAMASYGVGDTVDLGRAWLLRVKQVNTILASCLSPDISFTLDNFPMSSGSLVAKSFEYYLLTKYPELMKSVMLLTDSNDDKTWAELAQLKAAIELGGELEPINKKLRSSRFVHGLGMASIRNYLILSRTTGLFGSVVAGGRCVNEDPHDNPYHNRIENVVDIDLSSCYGSALREFDYPFGIPTIVGLDVDDKALTVGEVMESYGKDLVPGLWTMYVEGRIEFDQDLVHSKYGLTTKNIVQKLANETFEQETDAGVWGREIETAHIGGEFVLTSRQLESGIITSEVWKVIKAVSTSQEFRGWSNLKVKALVYYPASEELPVSDWTAHINSPTRGTKTGKFGDRRTNKWCRLPLNGFIGAFIDHRKALKKQGKQFEKGSREARELDLQQEAVKLFVNTTYGCLASPYFPMGNTVVANNITAKARTGVWMMSKALATVQSITDGGMFDWLKVFTLTASNGGRKPGFHVLSNRQRMDKHRGLKRVHLTDRDVWDWMKYRNPEDEKELDAICTTHINNFWNPYSLTIPFNIEVKYDHTARSALYFGSADYLLFDMVKDAGDYTEDGKFCLIKCRGAKEANHPKKLWLKHLHNPDLHPLPEAYFEYEELIGIKDFQKKPDDELMPGDAKLSTTIHKPWKSGRLYETYNDYKRSLDSKKKADQRHGKQVKQGGKIIRYGYAKAIEDGKLKP